MSQEAKEGGYGKHVHCSTLDMGACEATSNGQRRVAYLSHLNRLRHGSVRRGPEEDESARVRAVGITDLARLPFLSFRSATTSNPVPTALSTK